MTRGLEIKAVLKAVGALSSVSRLMAQSKARIAPQVEI